MADKETPFGLFSSSGKKRPQKEARAVQFPEAKSKREQAPRFDPQTQEMFNQVQQMQDEILGKLDYITRKSGMTKEEVLKKIQGPSANRHDVEKMNTELKAFAEKVWGALGPDIVPKKTSPVKATATEKDRKAKTLGARRNWLRMP